MINKKLSFGWTRISALTLLAAGLQCVSPRAGSAGVPFKGESENQAISAVPVDADHVFVTTVGEGNATHIGHFTFVSPHLSGLSDFSIDGEQFITAANGDELYVHLAGNLSLQVGADGTLFLVGGIPAQITGGTGRFANASGEFTFTLLFDIATAHSFATIDGRIDYSGK